MSQDARVIACEIIAIGNELLIGDVQDTNTYWLIQQLTGLGGFVRRAQIVRDEFPAIADALHASLRAKSNLIITTGGLGPTADDLTLAAVAAALDLPIEEQPEAMAMLKRRYAELAATGWVAFAELNEARRKMGMFPRGALPLFNSVGGAPGALLRVNTSTIVCLPGVPPELVDIFTHSLAPHLREMFGDAAFVIRSLIVNCQDESALAEQLQEVVTRHPRVYIKSRAKRFGPDVRIGITLSASAPSEEAANQLVNAAQSDIEEMLKGLGFGWEVAG
mgnify:CR=1 FL=1